MQNTAHQKRIIWGIIITVVILASGLVGYNLHTSSMRKGKLAVTVNLLPQDASATAGDQKIKEGTNYLRAGTYTVTVSKEGFKKQTQSIEISPEQTYIQIGLDAESGEAKKWAAEHTKEYAEFERIVGNASAKQGAVFIEKNPITRLLPVDNLVYKIGYKNNEDKTISLTVHATTPDQRAAALQQIRDWGYDPVLYKIAFINFNNPLE